MNKSIYRIAIPLEFKSGLMPGSGSESNYIRITLNGKGEPVLHGSSLAGVLRATYRNYKGEGKEKFWFGKELESDKMQSENSKVKFEDMILNTGNVAKASILTHNAISRHTGAVIQKGLYSIEVLPPGTKGTVIIEVDCRKCEQEKGEEFIRQLADIFETGMYLGGSINRGIGLATAPQGIFPERFNLDTAEGYSALLDNRYDTRRNGPEIMEGKGIHGRPVNNNFSLELVWAVPRGEDLLVGDGQTITDYVLEPQRVRLADGSEHWRIPGSSIRGVFRAWMTRLAVREGKRIRDNDRSNPANNDAIGWGFISDAKEKMKFQEKPGLIDDPIMALFGSFYARGRIHISDAISKTPIAMNDDAERMHVAIDRFSGGANEGALFKNKVLTCARLEFSSAIRIENPMPEELSWLLKTLKAMHLGIISLGSSKSSGRLAIKAISECNKNEFKAKLEIFLGAHP